METVLDLAYMLFQLEVTRAIPGLLSATILPMLRRIENISSLCVAKRKYFGAFFF
jgi:hypothetical protein